MLPGRGGAARRPPRRAKPAHAVRCAGVRGGPQGPGPGGRRRGDAARVAADTHLPDARVVATRCNTPVFQELGGAHGISVYLHLWPPESRPAPRLRTMTADPADPSSLPRGLPNLPRHSVAFYAKLLAAWVAMGFRRPPTSPTPLTPAPRAMNRTRHGRPRGGGEGRGRRVVRPIPAEDRGLPAAAGAHRQGARRGPHEAGEALPPASGPYAGTTRARASPPRGTRAEGLVGRNAEPRREP